MKKLTLSLLLGASLLAGHAVAGTESKSFKDKVVVVEEECKFRDMEFQLDVFYTGFYGSKNDAKYKFSTGSGGGFGLNFFFAKYFGVGYEAAWYDNNGMAQHLPLGGNFFVRYPICSLNLAPYAMVGGGATWDTTCLGYGNVGGGLEYRITNNIGLFADGRYFYGGVQPTGNFRSGLRIAF